MEKSREFLKSSGEPEDPEVIARTDAEGLRLVAEHPNPPELEKMLNEVDFKLMEKIFENILAKSNVDPRTLNVITPNRICENFRSAWVTGVYSSEDNTIQLDFQSLQNQAKKKGINEEVVLLGVLIHEEVHATARNECRGVYFEKERFVSDSKQSGYARSTRKEGDVTGEIKQQTVYELFNEGVTDKLAEIIFREYLEQTGFIPRKDIEGVSEKVFGGHTYHKLVMDVDWLIEILAKELELNEDTVWQAIIRGAYEGKNFNKPEIQKEFEKIFSTYLMDRIATAEYIHDEETLKIALSDIEKHVRQKTQIDDSAQIQK